MPLSILVIISPQKGKEERVRNLITWVSGEVKDNESDTSAYACFSEEGDDEQGLDLYVYFEYGCPTHDTGVLCTIRGCSVEWLTNCVALG